MAYNEPMTQLKLSLFGPIQILVEGQLLLDSLRAKTLALLAYLAVEPDRPHRREVLTGLFWAELPDAAARNNLRQALHQLRQVLGRGDPPLLRITPQSVQLNPEGDTVLDVAEFAALVEATGQHNHRRPGACSACVERLERALALYRGDFLAGFFLKDSIAFEEWALVQRERFRLMALSALDVLAEYHARRGDCGRMEEVSRRQIELEPFLEEAHRRLMRALAWSGRPNAALAQYAALRQMLEEELAVPPEGPTLALAEQIQAGELPAPTPPTLWNWPTPPTSLIGREAELAALAGWLQSLEVRLVTVVGTGGVGKTRLALEAAQREATAFADGACWVPLATVSAVEFIVPAIAAALEVSFTGSAAPQEQLCRYLRERDLLLVLDNVEHLLAGAPLVAEMLAGCPQLKVLATSREPLRLRGEQQFPVAPLALPGPAEAAAGAADLVEVPSVALFARCARSVRPGFALDRENAAAVAGICIRLDGLPLAIELAAARTVLFTPRQMLERLGRRLVLLVDGARDLPPRQRTLRATLDWSYGLLTAGEQDLFARLAVFRGGGTLEAIAAVCVDPGEGWEGGAAPPEAVGEGLQSLLDKGLLQRQGSAGGEGEERFTMLETVREYARERLLESGAQVPVQERHAAYYAALAGEAGPGITGPQGAAWLKRLQEELNNLRAALQWALEREETEMALRMTGALGPFWDTCGYLDEGRRWLRAALDLPISGELAAEYPDGAGLALARARVLEGAGMLAEAQGDYDEAVTCFEEALALTRSAGDVGRISVLLAWLGWAAYELGEYARARACYEESLALTRKREKPSLGIVSFVLNGLGNLLQDQGDYAAARVYYEESLALRREIGYQSGVACTLHNLGETLLYQGDDPLQARELLQESLSLAWEVGDKTHIAAVMAALARVATELGQAARAAQLLSQGESLLLSIGAVIPLAGRQAYERCVEAVRAELGQAAFDAAWAEGRARTLEDAVAFALEEGA